MRNCGLRILYDRKIRNAEFTKPSICFCAQVPPLAAFSTEEKSFGRLEHVNAKISI
jgi:hypothetical protein